MSKNVKKGVNFEFEYFLFISCTGSEVYRNYSAILKEQHCRCFLKAFLSFFFLITVAKVLLRFRRIR
jgi:hypothetical protein